MKLVDPSGKEVTSKENKEAGELERQLNKRIEKLLEPVMNKIKLAGGQVPQQQLMQLSSAAHQMLFNRMVYNLAEPFPNYHDPYAIECGQTVWYWLKYRIVF